MISEKRGTCSRGKRIVPVFYRVRELKPNQIAALRKCELRVVQSSCMHLDCQFLSAANLRDSNRRNAEQTSCVYYFFTTYPSDMN